MTQNQTLSLDFENFRREMLPSLKAEFERKFGKEKLEALYIGIYSEQRDVKDAEYNRSAHSVMMAYFMAFGLKKPTETLKSLADLFIQEARKPNQAHPEGFTPKTGVMLSVARLIASLYLHEKRPLPRLNPEKTRA